MNPSRPVLVTILARRGQGKTTLLRSLARDVTTRSCYISSVPMNFEEAKSHCFGRIETVPMGDANAAALAVLDTAEGEWAMIDEADSFGGPGAGERNALIRVLSRSRNLGINVALVAKTPATVPRWITANADVLIWRPWNDPRYRSWLELSGLATEDPGEFGFYATDFTRTITLRSDRADLLGEIFP